MDAVRVGLAVSKGTSIVCATCKRFWEGRERGLPEPRCTVQSPCGSPLAGLAFPGYDGPISDFSRWCFVCGDQATHGVKAPRSAVVFGMCSKHITMVGSVQAVGLNGVSVQEVLSPQLRASPDKFFATPKKTLGQAIVEAEAEFAERDQR
jgi:hypothetical protein